MKIRISANHSNLYWRLNAEILKVEPWGPDGARVRAPIYVIFPRYPARYSKRCLLRVRRLSSPMARGS